MQTALGFKLSIPYVYESNDNLLTNNPMVIVESIPTEKDFHIVGENDEKKYTDIALRFSDRFMLTVQKHKSNNLYYICHVVSPSQGGVWELLFSELTYDEMVSKVKSIVQEEVDSIEQTLNHLKRVLG